MNDQHKSGGVTYKQVGQDYFAQRGLRRYARVGSLWALGVGAVISGHYSGWNFGLTQGFGGRRVDPHARAHRGRHVDGAQVLALGGGGLGLEHRLQQGIDHPIAPKFVETARCKEVIETGDAVEKGREVVVIRYEKGIAYVSTWDEFETKA